MPLLLREQIIARAAAALMGATPAGANVFRSREVSLTREQMPAITVLFDGEQTTRMGQHTDRNEMTLKVAIFSRGDPWDQLAEPVDAEAHRVLFADAQLAALVSDIRRTGTEPESEEADRTAGTLSVRYQITFLTRAGDPSRAPL